MERHRRRRGSTAADPLAGHRDRARVLILTQFSTRQTRAPAEPRSRSGSRDCPLSNTTPQGHGGPATLRERAGINRRSAPKRRAGSPFSAIYARSPDPGATGGRGRRTDNLSGSRRRTATRADRGQRTQGCSKETMYQTNFERQTPRPVSRGHSDRHRLVLPISTFNSPTTRRCTRDTLVTHVTRHMSRR